MGVILGTFFAIVLFGVLFALTWFYWVVVGINHPAAFWLALGSLIAVLSIIPAAACGDG